MPGTIPAITDPSVVTSTTTSQIPAPLSAPIGSTPLFTATATPNAGVPSTTPAPIGSAAEVASTSIPAGSSSSSSNSSFADPTANPAAPADQPGSSSKASLSPASLSAVGAPLPPAHPAAGVASIGAASAVVNASASSALAPSNQAAQMTSEMGKTAGEAQVSNDLKQRKVGASAPKQQPATAGKEQELKQFIERDGHFSLVRNFHLADAFTLMNGFCGAQSLFASARYLLTSDPRHAWFALWFPLFGAIFDLLDGKIARWRRSSSMLGQELDSLADSLSFGAAPAFAAYTLGLRLPLDTLVLTIFVCAGIARLARFNVTTAAVPHDASGKAKYFEGLPIPSSLVLVGGMAICLLLGRVEPGGLSIPAHPATASVWNPEDGKTYRFFGSLAHLLPKAAGHAISTVPFGTLRLDFAAPLARLLTATLVNTHLISAKTVLDVSAYGVLEIHTIAFLWLAWAMAMVSKTLRVPKP